MGQRDLRRLLITGAMAVVSWAVRRGETTDPWLLIAVACAMLENQTLFAPDHPGQRHAA